MKSSEEDAYPDPADDTRGQSAGNQQALIGHAKGGQSPHPNPADNIGGRAISRGSMRGSGI